MTSGISLKVGDKIVDYDQVHVICKIENGLVYYHPLSENDKSKKVESYIPIDNFKKAGIRPLMTKTEAKLFLKSFSDQKAFEIPVNANKNNNFKEYLYLNDPYKTGQLLSFLYARQSLPIYTKSDQLIFEQALNHLSSEISAALDISFDKAKSQIMSVLKK